VPGPASAPPTASGEGHAELERVQAEAQQQEGHEDRPEDAVEQEPAVRGEGERGEGAMAVDPAQALGEFGEEARAAPLGGTGRLNETDAGEGERRDEVAGDVGQDRDRSAERGDECAAEQRAGGLGDGGALVQPGVGAQQGAWRQSREERLGGGVVEERERAEAEGDQDDGGQAEQAQPPQHGHQGQDAGAGEIGGDQDGAPSSAVDQHTEDEAEQQVRQPAARVEEADIHRGAAEGRHHEHLQREDGHVVTETGDRLG
jgi:hypothetical protein